jgi:glyoxylate/hydroxypyruvate reductase A
LHFIKQIKTRKATRFSMQIIFYIPEVNHPQQWLDALRAQLPQATLRYWQPGDTEPADYAIVWAPPLEMLQTRNELKAIFLLGAGADSIMQIAAQLPAGVPVVRIEDAGMGAQMAEYVSYAVLRYFRCFDDYARLQAERQWEWHRPQERHKKDFSVAVLGMGVLGTHIIAQLLQLGFPVNGWSRSPKQMDGVQSFSGSDGLRACLSQSQVVVCILPLTPETTGILNRDTLVQLPRGAYVINVARGKHLIENDLLELVQSGHIAGATLDVFQQEPLPPEHAFWLEPRITVTPHIAARSLIQLSTAQLGAKIRGMAAGIAPSGVVDFTKGY